MKKVDAKKITAAHAHMSLNRCSHHNDEDGQEGRKNLAVIQ